MVKWVTEWTNLPFKIINHLKTKTDRKRKQFVSGKKETKKTNKTFYFLKNSSPQYTHTPNISKVSLCFSLKGYCLWPLLATVTGSYFIIFFLFYFYFIFFCMCGRKKYFTQKVFFLFFIVSPTLLPEIPLCFLFKKTWPLSEWVSDGHGFACIYKRPLCFALCFL